MAIWLAGCSTNDDIHAPMLSSIVPDHGAPGSIVALAGSYFCQRPDEGQEDPTCEQAGTVTFGSVPASAVTWADNAIQVEVPHVATGDVDVSIVAAGRFSNSVSFSVE